MPGLYLHILQLNPPSITVQSAFTRNPLDLSESLSRQIQSKTRKMCHKGCSACIASRCIHEFTRFAPKRNDENERIKGYTFYGFLFCCFVCFACFYFFFFCCASALRSAYLICNYNYAALPVLSAGLKLMLINHRVLPSSFSMRRSPA